MASTFQAVKPFNTGRWVVWTLYALLLVAAPLLFKSSLSLTLLSQAGYLVIICLSYNILLGQGGMLSFGHAVYSGLGSFLAIHAMNLAASGRFYIPLSLIPLVGGLSGLFFAALLGYVSTKKAGTTFAMITLGMGELVFAMSLMFPEFFGGEAGITTNRAYGKPLWGITFGPQIQVYYLIAVYCFFCTAAMFAFTRTPLGRMLNAVRDNPERVEFIGYNPRCVRYHAFIIAGFFAGIGGGLAAINSEIVTAEVVGSVRSGSLLLFTFLGGATFFFGPILGAVLMVLALVWLSELSMAWLLYVGLMFLFMVMHAPGGIASLIVMNLRVASFGKLKTLWLGYLALAVTAFAALMGAAAMVEMIYHLQLNAAVGPELKFMGLTLNAIQSATWLSAGLVFLTGLGLFELARRRFVVQWSRIQDEIEDEIETEIKRRELL
ncbi:branched-chain amino acid ABC transporter permease [Polaromonas naphthalenivorans]|uniref:Amino acid/amide ABC transporter membrane protein 2, HAAT family n=1 Tax=Polaromonas naphthalenivorans (strain CJ2) TaxID=365044 RepID=A1VNC1_POLNA|nr:branched-chain amino acid ABC transporter permease [Polaromonas naphthalenivorans]ABM37149.1 amino acid/amide ABC transporter membrane protein 2, HAAT family [Polaromonas naphthalenivorans CJ2]